MSLGKCLEFVLMGRYLITLNLSGYRPLIKIVSAMEQGGVRFDELERRKKKIQSCNLFVVNGKSGEYFSCIGITGKQNAVWSMTAF